jgi:hypothetical protein
MVASPTPTVPISSDSTRLMLTAGSRRRASAAAAIHPAVPPPTMTISRIECSLIARSLGQALPIRKHGEVTNLSCVPAATPAYKSDKSLVSLNGLNIGIDRQKPAKRARPAGEA